MSWAVLDDVEQGVAALIDPDSGRALGPLSGGDQRKEVLERFADTVGVDPSTLADWDLQARWKDWMLALTSKVKDAEGLVHEVGDLVTKVTHPDGGAEQIVDPTKDASGTTSSDSASQAADGSPSPGVNDPADRDLAGEAKVPITTETVLSGYAVCPTCSGFGDVVDAGGTHTCPTCDGNGEVPIDTPATNA